MSTLILEKNFEEIYEKTYSNTLKYIICKCNNLDDVNDILQDTYVEFYKALQQKKTIKNEEAFLIGIAKNKLKNYYTFKGKQKIVSIFTDNENVQIDISDNINLEEDIATKDNAEQIWNYLNNKNVLIAKVFYFHYGLDMKISDIAKELKLSESNIKNYIYRTLKELKGTFRKGGINKMANDNFKKICIDKLNKDTNYNAILKQVREECVMEEKKSFKMLKVAAAFLIVLVLGVASPQIYGKIKWNIEYKEYEQRKTIYGSASIQQAVEAGYAENIQMDYIYQDEIGVKIDSLMITDDYFEMLVDIKLPEDIEVNTDSFYYGFAVYDEDNNIYGVFERMHVGTNKVYNYNQKLYKELGLPKDTLPLFNSGGTGTYSAKKGNIIKKTRMSSAKGFPKSKELYIRIFDMGYNMTEIDKEKSKIIATEDFQISNAEWNIKIDVPEKFYERETVNLGIQDQIEGFEIEKFEATDTRITLIAKIEGLEDLIWAGKDMEGSEFSKALDESIYITDENGKTYYEKDLGLVKGTFKMFFDINTNNLEVDLFLNVKINGQLYTSKIILK